MQLTGGSHGAVWAKFNRFMRVNSYHEIAADQFGAAKAKLMQWRAGKRRNSPHPEAKKGTITAIQTRWRQDGTEAQGRAFMQATYGLSSLTELDVEQIQRVYEWTVKRR